MDIIETIVAEPTIGELAEAAVARGELGTFDYALPLYWADDVRKRIGESPVEFVWSYPEGSIWGEPFPLTDAARDLLARYNAA